MLESMVATIEKTQEMTNDVKAFEMPKTHSPAEQWTMACECTNVGKVLAALKADPRFVDNHNGSIVTIGEDWCTGVALLSRENGYCAICPMANTYYSVNPLIIGADGRVHLSTTSVGGVVYGSIEKYNVEHGREYLDAHHATWLKAETLTPINL